MNENDGRDRGVGWRRILLCGLLALVGLGCARSPAPAFQATANQATAAQATGFNNPEPGAGFSGYRLQQPGSRRLKPAARAWDERDDLRLLYVQLKLRDNTIDQDVAVVKALRNADWFTHIILVVPSWQERPNAAHNPIVRRAMATCRAMRLGVFWGRWLWVGWPSNELKEPLPGPASHFDATYYAAAIATLKAEARSLGAVGTFLDAEPYGDSKQKPTLKFKNLGPKDRLAISEAVRAAVQHAGQVDLLYPTSSNRKSHYSWPLEGMGRFRCDAKSFYQHKSSGKIVANPPEGYEHRLDFWGSFVTVETRQIGGPTSTSWTLTIAEAKALDLDVIRRRYPEGRGIWVYSDELLAVLREWGS